MTFQIRHHTSQLDQRKRAGDYSKPYAPGGKGKAEEDALLAAMGGAKTLEESIHRPLCPVERKILAYLGNGRERTIDEIRDHIRPVTRKEINYFKHCLNRFSREKRIIRDQIQAGGAYIVSYIYPQHITTADRLAMAKREAQR